MVFNSKLSIKRRISSIRSVFSVLALTDRADRDLSLLASKVPLLWYPKDSFPRDFSLTEGKKGHTKKCECDLHLFLQNVPLGIAPTASLRGTVIQPGPHWPYLGPSAETFSRERRHLGPRRYSGRPSFPFRSERFRNQTLISSTYVISETRKTGP